MLSLRQKLIWVAIFATAGIVFWITAVVGLNDRSLLFCEDGDKFFIDERDIMETGDLMRLSQDLILIDLKRCKLTYYRDGVIFKMYTVAVGKDTTPSPVGEWKVIHKGGNWGGGFGIRWLGLNVPWGIYGIHGTNKPYSIGSPSSHGCIRMNNKNVIELYSLVKLGTPVHITGGELPKVYFVRKEYRKKDVSKHILHLQYALRRMGFNPGTANGRFGLPMEQAVLRLEKFYGLPQDGVISLDEQYILGVR